MSELKYKVRDISAKFKKLNGLLNISYENVHDTNVEKFGTSELINLFEIRSFLDNLSFYVNNDKDLSRSEIMDLIESADHVYSELSEIIEDDSKNTSYFVSRFDQYKKNYETFQILVEPFN